MSQQETTYRKKSGIVLFDTNGIEHGLLRRNNKNKGIYKLTVEI